MEQSEAKPPARTGGEDLSAGLSWERLRRLIEQRREMLLDQVGGEMPLDWEAHLDAVDVDVAEGKLTPFDGDLRRLMWWFHFWQVWRHGLRGGAAASVEERSVAIQELQERVPVPVRLTTGRIIHVTNRSYAAITLIGAHWVRIRMLLDEMQDTHEYMARILLRARGVSWRRRRVYRALMRRVELGYQQQFAELFYQRERLYAHAFTDDGGPARGEQPAPAWWTEIEPEDDASIILAFAAAGPQRLAKLPPPLERPNAARSAENWGYEAMFAWLEGHHGLRPASLRNEDVYRFSAWLRLQMAAEPVHEDK